MSNKNKRPIFLDLTRIRMPVTALISISHRIAGILIFLSLPFAIYLLDLSLRDEQSFEQVRTLLGHGVVKLLVVVLLWALGHHLFAGIRVLLIDIGFGVAREEARRTAWVIAAGSALALLMIGGIILW